MSYSRWSTGVPRYEHPRRELPYVPNERECALWHTYSGGCEGKYTLENQTFGICYPNEDNTILTYAQVRDLLDYGGFKRVVPHWDEASEAQRTDLYFCMVRFMEDREEMFRGNRSLQGIGNWLRRIDERWMFWKINRWG